MANIKPLNICVVDDEEILRVSLTDDLSDNGHNVNDFENSLDAIEFIKNNEVDLVITDIRMPNLDGIEFLSLIKKFNPLVHCNISFCLSPVIARSVATKQSLVL